MNEPTAFVLSPVDAVDLVHRALRKMENTGDRPDYVSQCVDSILSSTVFQLRNRAVVFAPEQRDAYDTLLKFVK